MRCCRNRDELESKYNELKNTYENNSKEKRELLEKAKEPKKQKDLKKK